MGRKNIAFLKELYLGKLTYSLRNKIKEMAATPSIKTEEIVSLITDYYKLLGSENTQKSINKKMSKMQPATLRNALKNGEMELFTIIEPFFDIKFENIKTAARLLKVSLDEYVTITDDEGHKITTDRPIPVGISYFQFLEHFSSQYASVGGAVKWNSITKQPVKTGGGGNVGSIGQLDISAFITYNADNIIQELLTARSDNHKMKRDMYTSISETGELYNPSDEDLKALSTGGGTSDLKNIYIQALGLVTK